MNCRKFKTNSFFAGGRHKTATIFFKGYVTKTGQNLLTGNYVQCNRKISMIICDNTIAAE